MKKPVVSGTEAVNEYMAKLEHPFKAEIQAIRKIVLNANSKMAERVKWNAPSFYYQLDFGAFHIRETKHVHLVLVFPKGIPQNENPLLQGDYKDRRMAYFYSMEDVLAKKPLLEKVVNDWVELVEK
jgi:uncharacterized protein YdhG (YjbR/CyaY superfamily)